MKSTLTATLALLAMAGTSFGQFLWDGDTDTIFANPDNWAGGVAPNSTGQVIIRNVSGGTPFAPELTTLYKTGPTGIGGEFFIGDSGTSGTLDINAGGTLDSSGNIMYVGENGGTGTVNVNAGGQLTSDFHIRLGELAGSTGWINVNGGSVSVAQITTNGGSSGYNVASGSLVSSGNIPMAGTTTSTISGGSIAAAGELWVGQFGSGTVLYQTAGSVSSGAWTAIGRDGTGSAYNLSGGTLTAVDNPANTAHFLAIGSFGGASGTLNVSNDATVSVPNGIGALIGEGGTGLLNIEGSNATINLAADLRVGLNPDNTDSAGVGTVSFVADAGGVSSIVLGGDVNLSSPDGDFLSVDLSAMGDVGGNTLVDVLLLDGATSQGEFVGLAQGAIVPGANGGTIDYSDAGNIWIRNVSIPEPTSALLGGLGLLALLRRRRQG